MGLEPWEERKAHFSSSIDPKVLQKMVWILEEENFKREMNIIRQQIKNEKKKNRETNAQAFELLIKWRLAQVKEKNDNAVPWYKQIYVFLKKL